MSKKKHKPRPDKPNGEERRLAHHARRTTVFPIKAGSGRRTRWEFMS
jgi:hypothetical protein